MPGRSRERVAPIAPEPVDAAHEPGGFALVFPLIAVAGWVDALGPVQWHGLYTSFMSGNSTTLGAAPTQGDWQGALQAGRAVLVFVLGCVMGELIGPAARHWRGTAVVGAEAACLWLAFAAGQAGWSLSTVASVTGIAMGLQTAAVHKVDGTNIALTYMTGTLVAFGRGIAAALRGAAPWRRALPFAGCWLSLVMGAVAGGFVARAAPSAALGIAATAATALAVAAAVGVVVRRRRATA